MNGKENSMSTKRVMSMETKIYHKPNCRFAKRIKKKNKITLPGKDARRQGYRPCKCCNKMSYLYRTEKGLMSCFEKKKNMKFLYQKGILYAATRVGCWKLVYLKDAEMITLYHRNSFKPGEGFDRPQEGRYHRQRDQQYFISIHKALIYIDAHDRFREAEQNGAKEIAFSNEKYRRQAEKRKRRKEINRVNNLFRLLESQNTEYIKYSIC